MKTKSSPLVYAFWIAALIVLGLAAGKVFFDKVRGGEKPPVFGQVADFALTERSGKTVTLSALKGKPWVASFIFTRCAGICPMMCGHMKKLQERLVGREIRFVSFSVDPEYDTAERLSEYAKRFKADSEKWLFLTGDKKTIFNLSVKSFMLGVSDVPQGEEIAPDQVVTHSSRFALVDAEGAIRGTYESGEPDFLERLIKDFERIDK